MGNLLAFDWDSAELRVVLGTVSGGRVRIAQAEAIPLGQDVDVDDAEQIGKLLRASLDERRWDADDAIGCVGRRDAVLHEILLPAAPAGDLAKMIHFQATSELSALEEECVYDYLTFSREGGSGVRAWVVVTPRQGVDAISRAAAAAGLRLRAIRLQSLARVAARQRWGPLTEDRADPSVEVLLAADSHFVEALATRRGEPLISQLVARLDDRADLSETARTAVNRVRAALSFRTPAVIAESFAVCAPAAAGWSDRLKSELTEPTVLFDPLEHVGGVPDASWDALATLAGALAIETLGKKRSIDFLHPRRPAPVHPVQRYRWAIAGAAALLAVIAAGLHVRSSFGARDRELARWQSERRRDEAELDKLQAFAEQQSAVAEWRSRHLNWLDEYQKVLQLLPDASQMHLTRVSFALGSPGRAQGAIRLEGFAASEAAVAAIALRLGTDGRYQLRPGGIVPSSQNRNYPWRFEAELTIVPNDEGTASVARTTGSTVALRR